MSALANTLAEQFRKHAGELPGAGKPRVVKQRERAFSQFEARGIPTLKLECWKYTDIRALRDMSYIALGESHDRDSGDLNLPSLPLPEFTPHVAIFLDGEFCPRLSTLDSLPQGVALSTIGSLLQEESDTIIDHMASNESAFPALNSALLSDGLFIDLAPNTVLTDPIHVIFLNQQTDAPRLNTARLIVNGGQSSHCVIVESHYSLDGAQSMTNALTEIETHDGACAV
ncbi:MAG: hypothetical protein VCB07_10945, partial [Gammaproteobacteria bacterium]